MWSDRAIGVSQEQLQDACWPSVQTACIPKPPAECPPDACPLSKWPKAVPTSGKSTLKRYLHSGGTFLLAWAQIAPSPIQMWDHLWSTGWGMEWSTCALPYTSSQPACEWLHCRGGACRCLETAHLTLLLVFRLITPTVFFNLRKPKQLK